MPKKTNKLQEVETKVVELLKQMSIEADVDVKQDGNHFYISVESPDTPLLIGMRGQNLAALEYIARLMTLKEGEEFTLSIDAGGYRAKRMEELERLAKEVAWRVRQTNHEEDMTGLNAAERRHIHQVISSIEGVTTESVGYGRDRRLVIKTE